MCQNPLHMEMCAVEFSENFEKFLDLLFKQKQILIWLVEYIISRPKQSKVFIKVERRQLVDERLPTRPQDKTKNKLLFYFPICDH